MKVGDLVTATWVRSIQDEAKPVLGIVLCIDPEEIGDNEEVMVLWNDGDMSNASMRYLEVISERS